MQAIGIFLQGCFLFNFATLMEYSVASYIERRRTRHNQKLNNNICSDSESEPASKKNSVIASSIFPTKGTTKDVCVLILINICECYNAYNLNIFYQWHYIGFIGRRKLTLGPLYDPLGVKPSAVDVYARIILPLLFVAFQIIYWATCLSFVSSVPEDTILIDRSKSPETQFNNSW